MIMPKSIMISLLVELTCLIFGKLSFVLIPVVSFWMTQVMEIMVIVVNVVVITV